MENTLRCLHFVILYSRLYFLARGKDEIEHIAGETIDLARSPD